MTPTRNLRRLLVTGGLALAFVSQPLIVFASENADVSHTDHSYSFLIIAVLLLAAKMWSFAEKLSIPNVLGELLTGIIFGNLFLFGISFFEPVKTNDIFAFMAELGAVILLFQVGLESNLSKLVKSGGRSTLIAFVGVVLPFSISTFVLMPLFFPDSSLAQTLFFSAALASTSVGISARLFQEFGKLQTRAAQLVLGSAVIDDVFGLIILAVVSSMATTGSLDMRELLLIVGRTMIFIVGSLLIGQLTAPFVSKAFSKISTGVGMKFTLAISFGLIFAYIAKQMGLEPIIGAFAAGLVLDPVHFKYFKDIEVIQDVKNALAHCKDESRQRVLASIEPHAHKQIEEIIEPVSLFLVPLFFIHTGLQVNLTAFANPQLVVIALVVTAAVVVTKMVCGIFAEKGDKLTVGLGMVPRGEVSLIYASIGSSLGVLSPDVFAVIVIVVVLTTFITPVLIGMIYRNQSQEMVLAENPFIRTWRKRLEILASKVHL